MYSRLGRRTRRISDSKLDNTEIRPRKRVVDADDTDEEEVTIGNTTLTPEEVQGLLELLPFKEALIKIAKGEFEIEKVEEAEEEEETEGEEGSEEAEEEEFEEDEDMSAEGSDEEEYDEEDYEDEDEEMTEDSAVNDAWAKRLKGNQK